MSTEAQPASTSTDDGLVVIPACDNPAVAFCREEWFKAHDEALAKSASEVVARVAVYEAYREAMPPLTGARNIRDFVACVRTAFSSMRSMRPRPRSFCMLLKLPTVRVAPKTRVKKILLERFSPEVDKFSNSARNT